MELNIKLIKHNNRKNSIARIFSTLAIWFLLITFIAVIIFILIRSIPGFQAYGFKGIFLTDQFYTSDASEHAASVWLPLAVTIIITIGSLLLAVPLGLKTATFIYFRVKNEKAKKILKIIIESCAAIPSVVFGLFAYKSLGLVIKKVFHLNTNNTLLTTIFMLALMVVPTIVLLTLNAYEGVDNSLVPNSMSLANSKTRSIYWIFRKQTRKQVIIAIIISATRVIGETMAVSMILSSENYTQVFNGGLLNILTSSLRPIGAVISKGMFAENGGESFKGLLFAFGLTMFIFVIILNFLVCIVTNSKNKNKFKWWHKITNLISNWILIVPYNVEFVVNKIVYRQSEVITLANYKTTMSSYMQEYAIKNKSSFLYDNYKLFWEMLDAIIVFLLIGWISLDILLKGLYAWSSPTSTLFSYAKDTTGQAVINTLLLILVVIIISLPISLFIAIWLTEYAKNKPLKKTILFFIDSIGATPSIIFGMFGLALFIEILHISSGGAMGNSLLAGALTMVIVILPTFSRMNQQALENVPNEIRENSYALGNSKWYTIKTLVLPQAYKGILSSTILTIGRILAETAPLFLTAGLSSSYTIALMNPSQTLTTRIYAQLNSNNGTQSNSIMYECALIALILIFALILAGYVVIPNWNNIKESIKFKWAIQKALWQQNKTKANLEQYKSQIQNNVLYLSTSQAKRLNVTEDHIWLFKDEWITTKIVSDYMIAKMENNYLVLNNKIKID